MIKIHLFKIIKKNGTKVFQTKKCTKPPTSYVFFIWNLKRFELKKPYVLFIIILNMSILVILDVIRKKMACNEIIWLEIIYLKQLKKNDLKLVIIKYYANLIR